ncbi:MAG: DsrE family protein [Magnetococcales bacterium]|nr:DsrE family protein [Magnetococcales bacterium]
MFWRGAALLGGVMVFGTLPALVHADPTTPSKFEATKYPPQKAVYHFNFAEPAQWQEGARRVANHLKTLEKNGDLARSRIVVVVNGNELHALARANRAVFPEVYPALEALTRQGVAVRICGNAANRRGYKPEEFYDLTTVVPAAVTELARLQEEGYAYLHLELADPLTREQLKARHPELEM